jgi:MFS family permease
MDAEDGKPAGKAKKAPMGGVLSAMGYRDYRLFWTGALVSDIGTVVQTTALMWFIRTTTNSNIWIGVISLVHTIPVLLHSELAGFMADKLNRKRLLIITMLVSMGGALLLAIVTSLGWTSMPLIVAIITLMSLAFTFGFPAWNTLLPDLVPRDYMLNALALGSAEWNISKIAGPAIGGLILVSWSAPGAFFVNAVSYIFVIVAIAVTKVKTPRKEIPQPKEVFWGLIARGNYVRSTKWMMKLLVIFGIASFFGFSYTVLLPAFAQQVLKGGSTAFSFLLVFTGLGAVLGAPLLTLLNSRFKARNILKGALLCFSLLLLGFSASHTYWLSALLAMGMGCMDLMTGSTVNTVLQTRADSDKRGSVTGFYIKMGMVASGFGGFFISALADFLGSPQLALQVGATAVLILTIVAISVPSLLVEVVTDEEDAAAT